jgi:hypothetical protein
MVIACMEKGSEASLEKKVDSREYSDDELISIKTKLNLPYYTSSKEFERSYGSININGTVYEYVKQRVYNDTLELLCLPNTVKTKLQQTSNELAKSSADGRASTPVKKGPSTPKVSLPDFFQPIPSYSVFSTQIERAYLLQNEAFSPSNFHSCPEQPPKAMEIAS